MSKHEHDLFIVPSGKLIPCVSWALCQCNLFLCLSFIVKQRWRLLRLSSWGTIALGSSSWLKYGAMRALLPSPRFVWNVNMNYTSVKWQLTHLNPDSNPVFTTYKHHCDLHNSAFTALSICRHLPNFNQVMMKTVGHLWSCCFCREFDPICSSVGFLIKRG